MVSIRKLLNPTDTMPTRIAGYIGRLIDMYGRPIHASVIYLRPQEINDPGTYQYTFPNRFVKGRYLVTAFAEYNVVKLAVRRSRRALSP